MSKVTENVSRYVKDKGINLTKLAKGTGLSYTALYNSLMNQERSRDLRDDEFLSICEFLEIDPRQFAPKNG